MRTPIAFMPLATYADTISDACVTTAIAFAESLGSAVHVGTFAIDVPQIYAPIGDVAFDIKGLVDAARATSATEAQRLKQLIAAAAPKATFTFYDDLSINGHAPAGLARLYALVVQPWEKDAAAIQDVTETMVFSAGRPTLIVPASAKPAKLTHLAIAWNDSRVAARALNDALPYLDEGGRITVLAVDTGASTAFASAADLAQTLEKRGYNAASVTIPKSEGSIAASLQMAALDQGATVLAMGGFGHSRLRDFVLGGATKGVLTDLRLPVLLSH